MLKRTYSLVLTVIMMLVSLTVKSQTVEPPFLKYTNHPWVDSVFNSLSIKERVAQLIWVAAYSNKDLEYEAELGNLIKTTGIGGLIFFQDDPVKQSEMINYFNKISKVPLMIGMDGEWGAGMRLAGVPKFPYQMTLGALNNDSLIYEMGAAVAQQFKRTGMHINLAPVVDINNNRKNTVINYRSFGEDPEKVSRKGALYMNGMQDNGILAVAKHFPGHGDTETDSHVDMPVIRHSSSRLDSVELVPFRRLISEGVAGVMPGHLNIPSLDSTPGLPTTLSSPILTGLLRDKLQFSGIAISDAMNMGALTRYYKPGEAEALSLIAGMDVLEYVTDPELTINIIVEKIKKGEVSEEAINLKCRKVLAAKYWAGLDKVKEIKTKGLKEDLSNAKTNALIRDLYAGSLTLLNNESEFIPLKFTPGLKIAVIAVNKTATTTFQKRIKKYYQCDLFNINSEDTASVNPVLRKMKNYNLIIAGVYGLDQRPSAGFGIKPGMISFIDRIAGQNSIVAWYGNPYGVDKIPSLQKTGGLVLAYQENEFTEDLSAQLIFGAIGAAGKLPVTINEKWPAGCGIETPGKIRLQYGYPENAGVSSALLEKKIDSLIQAGLDAKAFPGCEVMVARKGISIFHKAYGYQTYENRLTVNEDDLYDIASVTKVSSTIPAMMILDGRNQFSPDKTLGDYLPGFKKSNKGDIPMREFLAHQAGLTAWIPFWEKTVKKNGGFRHRVFSPGMTKKYPLEVADGIFINKNYKKKILKEIKKSPIGEKKYLYSDLMFILAPDIIENITGRKLDEFVTNEVYHKLGAFDITYNPYKKHSLTRIVPTEYDSAFRKQLLHGTVHDEGAAMLGGVSGHAGLFVTANDLMKLMELYRRMGEYGGEQLIDSAVLKEYTSVQFPGNNNRRGLGFDKPLLNNSEVPAKNAYPSKSATPSSFGHSGYTGAFVWVDPEYEISYIFLCNRVYPTRNNNLLSQMNIRTDVLEAVYGAVVE
ncbi:MAG TPA: glycoside hydrolase family 3 N-terminal domain-containing protein [Bacteroidales bacterium]|nr:glycoside hydrolase family 3 N-terminal domain-containing protein [Bacteroidales bacterium]